MPGLETIRPKYSLRLVTCLLHVPRAERCATVVVLSAEGCVCMLSARKLQVCALGNGVCSGEAGGTWDGLLSATTDGESIVFTSSSASTDDGEEQDAFFRAVWGEGFPFYLCMYSLSLLRYCFAPRKQFAVAYDCGRISFALALLAAAFVPLRAPPSSCPGAPYRPFPKAKADGLWRFSLCLVGRCFVNDCEGRPRLISSPVVWERRYCMRKTALSPGIWSGPCCPFC